MISPTKDSFLILRGIVAKENKTVHEINSFLRYSGNTDNKEDKKMIFSQIKDLKDYLRKINFELFKTLNEISLVKPLERTEESILKIPQLSLIKEEVRERPIEKKAGKKKVSAKEFSISSFEKETLRRLKKKEKEVIHKKVKKPSKYINIANKMFSNISIKILEGGMFKKLGKNLVRANLQFLPKSYISVIFLSVLLSFVLSIFLFAFFLFFSISPELPIIIPVIEGLAARAIKIFWILFLIPLATFLFMYFYPSMERKSSERNINQELPFATIHMSAISGSMIEPSKIFKIIILTKEYPHIEREFIKLINEVNVLGRDLVSALRNSAFNSPSKRLAELFNGLATTINSGGDLPGFFDKRAQSLLFEYRIEKEKYTRAAETFMDIYISVVIAAPMILMLLLIMMKVSGLGISISTSMITLVMILGVSLVNIVFLTFLHLKQPSE